jgi:hypothetical protein
MPGLENGSDQRNAFTWDHTQYPGGTRVTGALAPYTGGNYQDYWALYLKAGRTYVFQTRLPTVFGPYLYLYDSNGNYITYDYYSGDDGNGMAKITYPCAQDGWYYLVVYLYSGSYGFYVLESVPAPKSLKSFAVSPARFNARNTLEAAAWSRFDAIGQKIFTGNTSRFDIRSQTTRGNAGHFSARAKREAGIGNRFNAIKTIIVVISPSRFDARAGMTGLNPCLFDIRACQEFRVPSLFDMRHVELADIISRFGVQACILGGVSPSRNDALVRPGWTLYARDTETGAARLLGFIPADADPRELLGVPLPDGVYEIEVRPSEWFWDECRGRKVITLIAGSAGGGGTTTGLPVIQNLRREIVSFQSVIKWNVVAEYEPGAFRFGLWFGATSPVNTSGPPDQTVGYVSGQGEYQAARAQTASEYVAVAACTDAEQGPAAEMFLDWDTVAPVSPPDQYASAVH